MILVGLRRSFMSIAGVVRSSAFDRDTLVKTPEKSKQTQSIVLFVLHLLELREDMEVLTPSEIRENTEE